MGSIDIKSAKIRGTKLLHADYSYEQTSESSSEMVDVSSDAPVHDDMRLTFRQLVPHLAFMCEEVDESKDLEKSMDNINSLPEGNFLLTRLDKYKVTAFKVTGAGDAAGVVLTGQKKLTNGKVVNLNTPNLKWEDEYEFVQELRMAIERCKSEVLLYMDGKQAPEAQLSIFDQSEEEGEEDDGTE